jgi:hypothetical protein
VSVERGAAAVRVELSRGVVIVRHGESGTILRRFSVREGAWDAFWDAMVGTLGEFSLAGGGDAL